MRIYSFNVSCMHVCNFGSLKESGVFFDWLTVHQDFSFRIPLVGTREIVVIDTDTGEEIHSKCPSIQHSGSYSTQIQIRIAGNRLTVSGNPSRFDRLDNLFGLTTVDQCLAVYNRVLRSYGLPEFTKCTQVFFSQQPTGKVMKISDGAVITEIHVTGNKSVGACINDYLKGLSTLPYRNSIPRLHTNGMTCDWLTKAGKGGRLVYPSVYNKANEIALHTLPKVKRSFGDDSQEYQYLLQLIEYCKSEGVARFELKLKSEFLRRSDACFWGLFDESIFRSVHDDFLKLDEKLQVEAMDIETISEKLIREGICETTRSANTTTLYVIQWMHGHRFDFSKTQVQTHRARLRKIGIDIALPCDLTKFSLVSVRSSSSVVVRPLSVPAWYRRAENHLKLVA